MKYEWIKQEGNPRLLMFFVGWAADATPFRTYDPEGRDLVVCYDYRNLDLDLNVESYDVVDIVGWSMGVWVASQVAPTLGVPIGQAIALNGTPDPIDSRRGIHPHTWQATLDGLTPESLHKFCRRMCADQAAFQDFLRVTPRRPFDEVVEELCILGGEVLLRPTSNMYWTLAIAGARDRIFPAANVVRAWEERGSIVVTTEDAHYSAPMFRFYLQDIWTSEE